MYTIENPPICIVCQEKMTLIPSSQLQKMYTETYRIPTKKEALLPIVWACKPFRIGMIARGCHYQFASDDQDSIVYEVFEIDQYRVRNYKDCALISHVRDNTYQHVCNIDCRLDTSNFNKEKFVNKLKTYVLFS